MASMRWSLRCPAGILGAALQISRRPSSCEDKMSTPPESAMNEKMSRLAYVSTMRGDVGTAARNIESIAAQSVLPNVRRRLSGHMCYDAGQKTVWQVVEGSSDTVEKLWAQISKDTRHIIDEDTISCELVESRRYPLGWGMRYTRFEQVDDDDKVKSSSGKLCQVKSKHADLIQLSYKSFLKDLDGAERQIMEEVIPRALVKNAKLGITGFLLYNDRTTTVYQLLEGPPDVVESLWNTIRQDPRHDVCIGSVQRREVADREFPNWSMALEHVEQTKWAAAAY